MVTKEEAWGSFWNKAAEIAVNHALRSAEMTPREKWDRDEIDRRVQRCDRAMRELRAALRDLPKPNPLTHEFGQMREAVRRATVANRELKAEWHAVRPDA